MSSKTRPARASVKAPSGGPADSELPEQCGPPTPASGFAIAGAHDASSGDANIFAEYDARNTSSGESRPVSLPPITDDSLSHIDPLVMMAATPAPPVMEEDEDPAIEARLSETAPFVPPDTLLAAATPEEDLAKTGEWSSAPRIPHVRRAIQGTPAGCAAVMRRRKR